MAYHIYTTKGIILSSRPSREADRTYSILTEGLGLVRATARGVRLEKSKLRGALEPYVLSSVSLVRGKEYWRITSASILHSFPASPLIGRPLDLLEKLVQGEDPHPELFRAVEHLLLDEPSEEFEIRLAAEILYHLGYLREEDLSLRKSELVVAINRGLHTSQLV